jgi:hypothetical protein
LSSILRALKKLENEPRHREGSQHLDSKFVPLADIGTQRPASSIFIMVIGGGIVCGLVILAGWWLFSEKFQSPPAVPPQIPRLDSRLDESPSPSQGLNKAPVRAVAEKKSIQTPETRKAAEQDREHEPASLEKPAAQIIGQEDALPAEEQTPEETVPAQEIPSLKTNEQFTQPAEKTVALSDSTQVTPVKTVEVEIPKLNDPDMKLQAVTWSRAPQKRITVINNRILREGDMVSGYFINSINQDDVVISRGGEKWQLLFR